MTLQKITNGGAGSVLSSAIGSGGATAAATDSAMKIAGFDGTNIRLIAVDSYGYLKIAGYNDSSSNISFVDDNPLNLQYLSSENEYVNIATNTTDYVYIDMTGYRYIGIQGDTSGSTPTDTLTVTFEGSNQSGTAAASCSYQDITNDISGVANYVDTDFMVLVDTALPIKYLRIKIVTSNDSGNDADLTLYIKKFY